MTDLDGPVFKIGRDVVKILRGIHQRAGNVGLVGLACEPSRSYCLFAVIPGIVHNRGNINSAALVAYGRILQAMKPARFPPFSSHEKSPAVANEAKGCGRAVSGRCGAACTQAGHSRQAITAASGSGSGEPGVNWRAWTKKDGGEMAQPDNAAVLERAKALANEDGFAWELDFGAPGVPREKLRGQHFLSRDRQQEYLERARAELREETSSA